MDKDTFILNNQTYSNNNNILLGIINELQQIANSSHEKLTIKRISDVIIKMNFIINENKKTRELIMNQFTSLQNQISQLSQNLKMELMMERELCITPMEIDMKANGKKITKKEKEFIILIMEIDMKEILKMVKEMEKELCIIQMEIEKWVIIQMMEKLENM